jgi:hypothetical protein
VVAVIVVTPVSAARQYPTLACQVEGAPPPPLLLTLVTHVLPALSENATVGVPPPELVALNTTRRSLTVGDSVIVAAFAAFAAELWKVYDDMG